MQNADILILDREAGLADVWAVGRKQKAPDAEDQLREVLFFLSANRMMDVEKRVGI
jgi:hypothetical protein